jgi:hypothetical protein
MVRFLRLLHKGGSDGSGAQNIREEFLKAYDSHRNHGFIQDKRLAASLYWPNLVFLNRYRFLALDVWCLEV